MDGKNVPRDGTHKTPDLEARSATHLEQTFVLPFPPSVNNLFSHSRSTGKRFVNSKYQAWRREAGWALKAQNPQKTTGPVTIAIHAVRPDNRRRDIDNLAKAVNDLLVMHAVIEDDARIETLNMSWVSSDLQGVSVTVIGARKAPV